MSGTSDTNENESALVALARKRFPDLSDAEKILLRKTAAGEWADFTATDKKKNDPAQADNWGEDRRLRSEVIAWLCTDPEASKLVTHCGVQVEGARIEGLLDLSFAQIPFPLGLFRSSLPGGIVLVNASIRALCLNGSRSGPIPADAMEVEGYVFLREGFTSEGEVRLRGATIGGDLDCRNGHLTNPGGDALSAGGMKAGGSVLLDNGFTADGEVCLLGATIGGNLSCANGHFSKPKGQALNAERIKVQGNVFLRESFTAEGQVNVRGATIGGQLDCNGGHFTKPNDNPKDDPKVYALNAEEVEVRGHVFFRYGAKFDGRVNLESARIGRILVWTGIESPEKAILDLRRAQCVAIWDEEDSWPSAGNLFLDGFAYKSICEDAPPDAASRIRWLHLQPRDKFLPQPYEQLADVLRQSGHEEEARKILIQKGKDAGRTLPDFRWFVHWLFGLTAAYGHRPLKAFGWIVFFMLLGWVAFGIAHEANLMVETKIAERIDDGTATDCSVTSEYPEFDALIYSMDTFIPVIDLGQACYWQPSSMRMAEWRPLASVALPVNGMMALVYQRFHTIFGWALTTLFILGLTGLLKK